MKNLVRECKWYNPMTAYTKDMKAYELDNIIIYSEEGKLIETDCGWFSHSNNDLEGVEIKPEIIKKIKVDFTSKQNFVTKSEKKDYRFDCKYTLYLYYKNVNYKYLGLSLDSLFLRINYSILDNLNYEMVIGDRNKKAYEVEYSDELTNAFKKVDSYNMRYNPEEFKKALKILAKMQKKYEEAKQEDESKTTENAQELIRESCKEFLENNKKLVD